MHDGGLNAYTFTKDHKKSNFALYLGELCGLSLNMYSYSRFLLGYDCLMFFIGLWAF